MTKSPEPKSQMGAAITVRLSSAGKKDAIYGIMDDGTLMVQLTSNPETDPANHELVVFMAKVLNLPVTAIEIVAGQKGKDKLIAITGLSAIVVQQKLLISAGLTQAELNRRRQNSATHRNEP